MNCPKCGGVADNGHDRELPPNPYYCSKCSSNEEREPMTENWVVYTKNGKRYEEKLTGTKPVTIGGAYDVEFEVRPKTSGCDGTEHWIKGGNDMSWIKAFREAMKLSHTVTNSDMLLLYIAALGFLAHMFVYH